MNELKQLYSIVKHAWITNIDHSILSTAIPQGHLNCPGSFPLDPNEVRNLPSHVNTETRWFLHSVTYINATSRLLSIQIPQGEFSSPLPLPYSPNFLINSPSEVNTWMRLLEESVTYTFPVLSHATSEGLSNSPLPLPRLPKLPQIVRSGLRNRTWWLYWSATYSFLFSGLMTIPLGQSNSRCLLPSLPTAVIN